MTVRLRRLVSLAATLAPARAVRLLGRLAGPRGGEAVRLAEALVGAPRRARLAALAASLPDERAAAQPPASPVPAHPLLRRLEAERRGRTVAGRTVVRPAADRPYPPRRDPGRLGRHDP